jgi:hypothetical protein
LRAIFSTLTDINRQARLHQQTAVSYLSRRQSSQIPARVESPHSRTAGKGTVIRFKNAGSQGNFFLTCDMESPLTPTLWYINHQRKHLAGFPAKPEVCHFEQA